MIKVEALFKKWPRNEARCQHDIIDAGKQYRDLWPETRGDYQCQRSARFKIDEKRYCSLHAGQVLIAHHLKGES